MEKDEKTKQDVMTSRPAEDTLTTFTDAELFAKSFPDLVRIVPDLIPEGLTLLAGKPKAGKSLFAYGIASCVAQGRKVLGEIEVEQREVLCLALEDTERRLKAILAKIQGNVGTGRIHFATVGPRKGESSTSFLEKLIRQHQAVKLIIIDTLGRFCGYKGVSSYQGSYDQLAEIKSVADKHSLAIMVIHHARKLKAGDDLDTVMGSTGITSAADTIMVLKRERRQNQGSLLISGREVEERELALQFEPDNLLWKLLGPANEIRMSQERLELIDLLRKESGEMRLKDITEALGKKRPVLSKLLSGLIESGLVEQPKYGFYKAAPTSSGETSDCGERGESSDTGKTRDEGETENEGESSIEKVCIEKIFNGYIKNDFIADETLTDWESEETIGDCDYEDDDIYLDQTAIDLAEGILRDIR